MANTLTVDTITKGVQQFQAVFSTLFMVRGTVSDQDAIADDVSVDITLTVPGVALGDICLGVSFSQSTQDANAGVTAHANVTAADTVVLRIVNIDAGADAYDADTLTGCVYRILIGRPTW